MGKRRENGLPFRIEKRKSKPNRPIKLQSRQVAIRFAKTPLLINYLLIKTIDKMDKKEKPPQRTANPTGESKRNRRRSKTTPKQENGVHKVDKRERRSEQKSVNTQTRDPCDPDVMVRRQTRKQRSPDDMLISLPS